MRQRGRPPHPDILTPREQDVLAQLREHLTNEQIADRLGISFETAKHHVGVILSKLGVATREEAAAWQPELEPAGRWTWPRIAGAIGGTAVVAAALAGLALLAWGVWESDDAEPDFTPAEGIAIEDLYENVGQSLPRDGSVLHSTWTGTSNVGAGTYEFAIDTWIDERQQVARSEYRSPDGPGFPTVYVNGREYRVEGEGPGLPVSLEMDCPFDAGLAALLLGCDEYIGPESTLEMGQHDGRNVIVLRTTETATNEDNTPTGTVERYVYVDMQSWLPTGGGGESHTLDGQVYNEVTFTVTYETVSANTLPDDFFSVAAIGYYEACAAVKEYDPVGYELTFECETPAP